MPASCLAHLRQARARRRAAPCVWWCILLITRVLIVSVCRLVCISCGVRTLYQCVHPVSGVATRVACRVLLSRTDTGRRRVCGGHRARTPRTGHSITCAAHLIRVRLDLVALVRRREAPDLRGSHSCLTREAERRKTAHTCLVCSLRSPVRFLYLECISHALSLSISVCLEIHIQIYISINMN